MATSTVSLNGLSYTSLGAGPLCMVPPKRMSILMYQGSAPSVDTGSAIVEIGPNDPLNYNFTDALYVKLRGGDTMSVLVLA